MANGYWVTCYRSVTDEAVLLGYARLAGPVIEALDGRFLARGVASASYEVGMKRRLVIIEFDSAVQAVTAYESTDYQVVCAGCLALRSAMCALSKASPSENSRRAALRLAAAADRDQAR